MMAWQVRYDSMHTYVQLNVVCVHVYIIRTLQSFVREFFCVFCPQECIFSWQITGMLTELQRFFYINNGVAKPSNFFVQNICSMQYMLCVYACSYVHMWFCITITYVIVQVIFCICIRHKSHYWQNGAKTFAPNKLYNVYSF